MRILKVRTPKSRYHKLLAFAASLSTADLHRAYSTTESPMHRYVFEIEMTRRDLEYVGSSSEDPNTGF